MNILFSKTSQRLHEIQRQSFCLYYPFAGNHKSQVCTFQVCTISEPMLSPLILSCLILSCREHWTQSNRSSPSWSNNLDVICAITFATSLVSYYMSLQRIYFSHFYADVISQVSWLLLFLLLVLLLVPLKLQGIKVDCTYLVLMAMFVQVAY